jgi:hypothetical protein
MRPIRNVSLDRARSYCNEVNGATIEPDGIRTTIRAYCAGNPELLAESNFPDRWLDEPVCAQVLSNEHSVWCSGRAVVGFYFQPDRDPYMRTARPAYLTFDERRGLRLVQSA